MRQSSVLNFLKHVAAHPELRCRLRTLTKREVLAEAKRMGFQFSEPDFDDTVWNAEMFLAQRIGEPFDFNFSLWETMWGKHYLDFIVDNVSGAISADLQRDFLAARGAPS